MKKKYRSKSNFRSIYEDETRFIERIIVNGKSYSLIKSAAYKESNDREFSDFIKYELR